MCRLLGASSPSGSPVFTGTYLPAYSWAPMISPITITTARATQSGITLAAAVQSWDGYYINITTQSTGAQPWKDDVYVDFLSYPASTYPNGAQAGASHIISNSSSMLTGSISFYSSFTAPPSVVLTVTGASADGVPLVATTVCSRDAIPWVPCT